MLCCQDDPSLSSSRWPLLLFMSPSYTDGGGGAGVCEGYILPSEEESSSLWISSIQVLLLDIDPFEVTRQRVVWYSVYFLLLVDWAPRVNRVFMMFMVLCFY